MEVSGQLYASAALPRGNNFGTYGIGGCGGARVVLDLLSVLGIEIRPLCRRAYSLVAIRTELSRVHS
jgi:hypothetical protein